MGESKRRKETDPNYGKKRQRLSHDKNGFDIRELDISKISKTELLLWTVFMGIAVATFIWTGTLQ